MTSTLSGPALQASRAALSAALADQPTSGELIGQDESLEPGEIQEVDMQAQADGIRTVFSDPTNFNVKVGQFPASTHVCKSHMLMIASALLPLDSLVRFPRH